MLIAFFSLHQSSWVIKWWFSIFFVFCFLIQCLLAYHQRCSSVVNAHSITAPLIRNIHTSPRHWSSMSGTPSSGNFSHFFPPQSSKARWFGCLRIICTLPAHILFVGVIRLFGFGMIRNCLFFLDFLPVLHLLKGRMRSAEGIYKSSVHKRTQLHSQKGSGSPDACLFGQVQCCPHREKGDQADRFKRKFID